jgi:anti-sigma-K factor RskA
LGVSLWANFQKPKEVIVTHEVPPKVLTISEQYNNLLASAKDLQKTTWTNPKNDKEILGEVVWSDAEQKGFMKFKGLAANDVSKETYQLWIFDETQDEKTPIDGGVFDVKESGEVLIPIDAKLKFQKPKLFAITVEKPGGVVVSKREKIAAIAKVL